MEWPAICFSRGSTQPRDQTCVSSIGRWIVTGLVQDAVIGVKGPVRASREAPAEQFLGFGGEASKNGRILECIFCFI